MSVSDTSPVPKKQLILNAFEIFAPGHLTAGTWTHDRSADFDTIDHWTDLAETLERGKIHGLFLADSYGTYDTYRGSIDPSLPAATQFPKGDPLLLISALAAVTTNLAFGVTSSTTYEAPFALARRYSTLDHLSNGRIGWNIVTSGLPSAARNLGLDKPIEHDKRYEIAEEYLEVVYKLWESSWHDNALKRDAVKGIFTDPALVRAINHKGPFFPDVPGPFITHPSAQRTPALFQAGSSGAGTSFGAKHAEAVFISQHDPESAALKVQEYRNKAEKLGRDPKSLKVLAGICIILGKTEQEAKAKFELWKGRASREGALALFGGWTGNDLSGYGDDEELNLVENGAILSTIANFKRIAPGVPKWTKNTVADFLLVGGMTPTIVGTPEQVADELERWVSVGDVDGFNLAHYARHETFEDIVDLLIPALQERGIFWKDYPEVPQKEGARRKVGITAREGLLGVGQKHLRADHPGSAYKWTTK